MLKVYICLKQAELFCGRKSYGGLRGPLVYRNTEEPHLSEEFLALQTELLGEYSREVSTIPPALLSVCQKQVMELSRTSCLVSFGPPVLS